MRNQETDIKRTQISTASKASHTAVDGEMYPLETLTKQHATAAREKFCFLFQEAPFTSENQLEGGTFWRNASCTKTGLAAIGTNAKGIMSPGGEARHGVDTWPPGHEMGNCI